jgi:hypothetical protein
MNAFSFARFVRILYPVVISLVSFALWIAALRAYPSGGLERVGLAQEPQIEFISR